MARLFTTNSGSRKWRYWLLRELGIAIRRGRPRKVRARA